MKFKKFVALVLSCLSVLALASCRKPDEKALEIYVLKGPTGIGASKLIDESENAGKNYNFTVCASPDQVTSALLGSSADIAALPVNLAATIVQKTNGKYKIAAINTLGVLYILERGQNIRSVSDLGGKTIYTSGKGSTPEFILRHILLSNGLDPDRDVNIEFKGDHTEIAALAASGKIDICMLPEPNVTSVMLKNSEFNIALDLSTEWEKVSGGTKLVQGCIVVSDELLQNRPELYRTFMNEYRTSVDFVNSDPGAAAKLCENHGIVPSAAIAEKAIPKCNIVLIEGDEVRRTLTPLFEVFFDENPQCIGGAIPDESFYAQN